VSLSKVECCDGEDFSEITSEGAWNINFRYFTTLIFTIFMMETRLKTILGLSDNNQKGKNFNVYFRVSAFETKMSGLVGLGDKLIESPSFWM